MRKRRLRIEDLRTCLSYDSEVKKFLSLKERCMIHQNQIKIIDRSFPLELTPELKEKLGEKLREIRKKRWKRPEYRFEKEWNVLKRIQI